MKIKIKMKNGNPCKWVRLGDVVEGNKQLIYLTSKEKASEIEIVSFHDIENYNEAFDDNSIEFIEIVEE